MSEPPLKMESLISSIGSVQRKLIQNFPDIENDTNKKVIQTIHFPPSPLETRKIPICAKRFGSILIALFFPIKIEFFISIFL